MKWQFGDSSVTTGRPRCRCDDDRGIYICSLVGMCAGDTAIVLRGARCSQRAIAGCCNRESFKCVSLLPHRARGQGVEPHPVGRPLWVGRWPRGLGGSRKSRFPAMGSRQGAGSLSIQLAMSMGSLGCPVPLTAPEGQTTLLTPRQRPFQAGPGRGQEEALSLFRFPCSCPRGTRDWKCLPLNRHS